MKEVYGPHLWQIRVMRDIFLIGVIVMFFNLVRWLWPIFMPICVSLLLAYLFNPTLHKAKARWNWSRPLTAGMIIGAATLLLIAFFIWLWPIAAEQSKALVEKLPQYLQTLAQRANIETGGCNRNQLIEYVCSFEVGRACISPKVHSYAMMLQCNTTILGPAGRTYSSSGLTGSASVARAVS